MIHQLDKSCPADFITREGKASSDFERVLCDGIRMLRFYTYFYLGASSARDDSVMGADGFEYLSNFSELIQRCSRAEVINDQQWLRFARA